MDWKKDEKNDATVKENTPKPMFNPLSKPNLYAIMKLNSNDYREFMCGWGSAIINITVTYPINKVIFRQILEGVPVTSAIRQLYHEGIRLLYRGMLPPLCQKSISLSLMFSVYEGSRSRLMILTNHQVFSRVVAANVAGTVETVLTPLERVQTLLQDWRYHDKFKNTSHAFRYILRTHGLWECYRGVLPIIYRNGLSNTMFFSLREQSKIWIDHDSMAGNFITGALIGGFTSTVFYPFNVIKIHVQSKLGGKRDRLVDVIKEIYVSRNRSVTSFYKGVHLNYMRSFISWGVINAAYDFLKHVI